MDKASDFGSEDAGFEFLRGRFLFRHKTEMLRTLVDMPIQASLEYFMVVWKS